MDGIYLHDWSDIEELKQDFELSEHALDGVEILLASYSYRDYSGDAFVLFRRDGKYFEVNGSHCSCYGLEDQWEPEEGSLKELKHRLQNGDFGRDDWTGNEFRDELLEVITKLEEETHGKISQETS